MGKPPTVERTVEHYVEHNVNLEVDIPLDIVFDVVFDGWGFVHARGPIPAISESLAVPRGPAGPARPPGAPGGSLKLRSWPCAPRRGRSGGLRGTII